MDQIAILSILVHILIYQTTFAKCEVADPDDSTLNESDNATGASLNESDNPSESASVSAGCSGYDISDLPHPRFILLGPTGVGKSTLANQLLGRNPFNKSEQVFSVGHGVESHTIDITWVVGNWLGDGPCFTIIDTPGTSDSEGRDYDHALAIANIMKDQMKSVDIFILCFNGQEPRFDQSIIDLLKLYESIFSQEMWKHAITEVTYWAHDRNSVRKRKRNKGVDEKIRHKEWNSQYKEELNVTIEIPSVYIDPVFPIFDPEEKEYIQERENEAFKKYTSELFQYGKDIPPFFCDGNCKAPNGYFLGNPWIKINNITERQGEKAVVSCHIWNGIQGKASDNVTWTHNGEVIYEKTTSKYEAESWVNATNVWGPKVKFVESKSPGEGHYTDFSIEFGSLDESMEGNYTCENGKISKNNYADVFMKVDGTWEKWGPWGKCSKGCLGEDNEMGSKERVRKSVPPRNGGDPVNPKDGVDTQVCAGEQGPEHPIPCPIDFSWNYWTQWSECSPGCGDGITYRVRSCNQGSNGGAMCPLSIDSNLSEKEEKSCKIKDCPDCILLEWQKWSQCTKTCITDNEPGTRIRQRTTKEADPNNPLCNPDDHSQRESCNAIHCPIDGVIGNWTNWSPSDQVCSKVCESPTQTPPKQTRTRICIAPQYNGKPCHAFTDQMPKKQTRKCPNVTKCSIDCRWNTWSLWTTCNRKCGKGSQTRTKDRKVSAKYGGKKCTYNGTETSQSEIVEERDCFLDHCPPCKNGEWTSWGSCPSGCKQFRQTRTRKWRKPDDYHILGDTIEDCDTKEPDTDEQYCDGMRTLHELHKHKGASYADIVTNCEDCECNKDDCSNCGCFAKGSKVTTPHGEKSIEDLRLGDGVLTLKNSLPHFTPFLGWIHKENNSSTQFLTLKTKSQHITITDKHVIFSKSSFAQTEPDTVFADNVNLGNYVQVLDGEEQRWEQVVSVEVSMGSGIYTPLTTEGTLLVDNILASCYADFTLQSVADFAFLPMKMVPGLLDDEVSQHEDGLRWYPRLLTQLGIMFNAVESVKTQDKIQPNVGQALVIIALLYRKK